MSDVATPRRWRPWRPRWSVRSLLIVVALVAAYLACWQPTHVEGIDDVRLRVDTEAVNSADIVVIAPLILRVDESHWYWGCWRTSEGCPANRHYYIWFFGLCVELPIGKVLNTDELIEELDAYKRQAEGY